MRVTRRLVIALGAAMLAVVAWSVPAGASGEVSQTAIGDWGTNGTVYTQAVVGSTLYLGGSFTKLVNFRTGQAVAVSNLAAVNTASGVPVSWRPSVNGTVFKLAASTNGAVIYAGGAFTAAGGVSRGHGAAFAASSGALQTWNPRTSGAVRAILPVGGRVFVGGDFTQVAGATHLRIVSVDPSSGAVQGDWSGAADCRVQALASDGTWLYVGGYFQYYDGVYQPGLIRVSAWTGARETGFNAGYIPNNGCNPPKHHEGMSPFDLSLSGSGLYVAVGGLRNILEAVNSSSGRLLWRDTADGDFQTLTLLGSYLYAGGHFDTGVTDPTGTYRFIHIVRVNPSNGYVDSSWAPALNPTHSPYFYGCWSIVTDGRSLFAGGVFQSVGSAPHRSFAIFPPA